MRPQRPRHAGLIAVLASGFLIGCFEDDALRTAGSGSTEDSTVADIDGGADSSETDAPGNDVTDDDAPQGDVPVVPDATPSGLFGGLVASGSVSSSPNFRMVSTLGAPVSAQMESASANYRMTTSLLSFSEASE